MEGRTDSRLLRRVGLAPVPASRDSCRTHCPLLRPMPLIVPFSDQCTTHAEETHSAD